MDFDLTFYIVAALVVVGTGISKAGFGAGFEMLAVPVLALFILPQTAAAIMLPILMAIDTANFWRWRRDFEMRILLYLMPAAIVGIGIGALTFEYIEPNWFKLGLGVLALGFVAQRVLLSPDRAFSKKPGRVVTSILGAMGGFTSFVAHAGSPPVKMVLLAENLPKQKFVGTNSYLFGSINWVKFFPYLYLGQFSSENLTVSLSLAPFVLAGIGLGFWLNGVVSEKLFTRIVFVALALAGLKLVWDGAIALL